MNLTLQWATLIVDTYERAAIQSLTREGALIQAYAPLTVIESAAKSTEKILAQKKKGASVDEQPCGDTARLAAADSPTYDLTDESLGVSVDFLQELGIDPDVLADATKCIDCDLRVNFDWQLQPLQLMNPIEKLLSDMEEILDDFQKRLDPLTLLGNLCDFFSGFEIMCMADLIRLLLMLQLLLKKYAMFSLKIQLDWTAVVGPLLKAILDGMVSLLGEIYQIVVLPIDCILGALRSGSQLVDAARDTLSAAIAAGQSLGSSSSNLKVSTVGEIPTGFTYSLTDTLSDKIESPSFEFSGPGDQLILAVQEAKKWVSDLYANLLLTLHSLNAFMSGSVAIQLRNAGLIMMVLDLVALMKLIIEMKQSFPDGNWCQELEEDPALVEQVLNGKERLRGIVVQTNQVTTGTEIDCSILDQWIKELG